MKNLFVFISFCFLSSCCCVENVSDFIALNHKRRTVHERITIEKYKIIHKSVDVWFFEDVHYYLLDRKGIPGMFFKKIKTYDKGCVVTFHQSDSAKKRSFNICERILIK